MAETESASSQAEGQILAPAVARRIDFPYAPGLLLLLGVALSAVAAWFCWLVVIPALWTWSEGSVWRAVPLVFGVMIVGFIPLYPVALGAMAAADLVTFRAERAETRGAKTLAELEEEIRGSEEPLDYARYSRAALKLYYDTGHNQVRLSFYVGVAAMLFGFAFLLAGLAIQVLDTSALPWIRANPDVQILAVGGGLVIEFVAATFLWTYRAAIVQLNVYYRRQMLIHSGLLSVSLAAKSKDPAVRAAAATAVVRAIMAPADPVEIETPAAKTPKSWLERLGLASPKAG